VVDRATVAVFGGTSKPFRPVLDGLNVTGNPADTSNNFPDISSVSDFAYFANNYIHDVTGGINIGHGPVTMGGYSGNFALPVDWEDQPNRATIGASIAFNNVVDVSTIGYEIFTANHSRFVGNGFHNQTDNSTQMAYRLTGYPGAPCWYNSLSANTAKKPGQGLSVQVSARYNSVNGLTVESPTTAGVALISNPAQPSWHHSNNYIQGLSSDGSHGVDAYKPQFNHLVWNVSGASTWGVELRNSGNYGLNKCNIVDAVVSDSAEGASINSTSNMIRLVTSEIDGRGITIAGANNIVDIICDNGSKTVTTVCVQVSGNNNQIRMSSTGNLNTVDVSVSGSGNVVDMMSGNTVAVSGDNNIFRGRLNTSGTTNISNSGNNNNFDGILGCSGMFFFSGTTNGTGDITVTSPIRHGGITYNAIAGISGTTQFNYTANFVSTTSLDTFKFRVFKSDGLAATSETVGLIVTYAAILLE